MEQDSSVFVKKGKILLFRFYDVALSINLQAVETCLKEGARRMVLKKLPNRRALNIPNPPVLVEMKPLPRTLFSRETEAAVTVKAFDFGAVSVCLSVNIPEGTSWTDVELAMQEADTKWELEKESLVYVRQLIDTVPEAFEKPQIKEGDYQDLAVCFVEKTSPVLDANEFIKECDPSKILLCETRELDENTRRQVVHNRFSYFPEDLVLIHGDSALLLEPGGSGDIVDLLEFAKAQLLELQYYDDVLDAELSRAYNEIGGARNISIWNLHSYERLAKKITQTVMDLTEVTERVDNALKVTEDVYYVRVYRGAVDVFRTRDWERSIREKMDALKDYYGILYNDIATKRGHLLEIGIIVLIIIEIFLFIDW